MTAPATLTGPSGAAAASVTPDSARGLDQFYTFGYPVAATGGTYTDKGMGSVETQGTVTFTIHGIPVTVVDPLVTLNGLTGTLKASGVTAGQGGQTSAYDRSKVQFNLDLSNAEVKLRADGSRADHRDRAARAPPTPRSRASVRTRARFGTMSLTLGLEPSGLAGAARRARDGATGPAGKDGRDGKDATFTVIRLARLRSPPSRKFTCADRPQDRQVDRARHRAAAHAAPRGPFRHDASRAPTCSSGPPRRPRASARPR